MATEQTPAGAIDNQPGNVAVVTEPVKTEPVKTEAPIAAPEKYEAFAAPEGVVLDAEVVTAFEGVAKEIGLPQASAQKVIDKLTPVLKARGDASIAQVKADLLAAATADKEFGGDKLAASVATARVVIDTCFTPAFGKFLNDTGLGNHPELIRGLLKIAPHIKQDTHVPAGRDPAGNDGAQKFYPNSNMNA